MVVDVMRLMKIKYPHNEELKDRLNTCLDMCCIPHVIFDDIDHYTFYIDKGKCTWKQVITEVNRVYSVKYKYESDLYIKNGKVYVNCGTIRV